MGRKEVNQRIDMHICFAHGHRQGGEGLWQDGKQVQEEDGERKGSTCNTLNNTD